MLAAPIHWRTPRNRTLNAHRRELDQFFARHIDARLQGEHSSKSDMLTAMIAARDPQGDAALSRQALIDETKTLFIAGYETTASAMTWTLALLAGHSDVAENWRAELDRVLGGTDCPDWRDLPNLTYSLQILNAEKNSMRLFPPVYNVARGVSRTTTSTAIGSGAARPC